MSRAIKFRAWIHEPNREPQMVDDVGIIPEGKKRNNYPMNISSTGIYVNPHCEWIELMQYTERKDKNGTEIYEGDVIQFLDERMKVFFNKYTACFDVEYIAGGCGECESLVSGEWDEEDVEVIGNIYEHPELIPHDLNEELNM